MNVVDKQQVGNKSAQPPHKTYFFYFFAFPLLLSLSSFLVSFSTLDTTRGGNDKRLIFAHEHFLQHTYNIHRHMYGRQTGVKWGWLGTPGAFICFFDNLFTLSPGGHNFLLPSAPSARSNRDNDFLVCGNFWVGGGWLCRVPRGLDDDGFSTKLVYPLETPAPLGKGSPLILSSPKLGVTYCGK